MQARSQSSSRTQKAQKRAKPKAKALPAAKMLLIESSFEFECSLEALFEAWATGLSHWWSRDFLVGENATTLTLEAQAGGLLYESWSGSSRKKGESLREHLVEGSIWGVVTEFEDLSRIEVTGAIGMAGIVHGKLGLDFQRTPHGSRLDLRHAAIGEVDAETQMGYEEGWSYLIDQCLRPHVESNS